MIRSFTEGVKEKSKLYFTIIELELSAGFLCNVAWESSFGEENIEHAN